MDRLTFPSRETAVGCIAQLCRDAEEVFRREGEVSPEQAAVEVMQQTVGGQSELTYVDRHVLTERIAQHVRMDAAERDERAVSEGVVEDSSVRVARTHNPLFSVLAGIATGAVVWLIGVVAPSEVREMSLSKYWVPVVVVAMTGGHVVVSVLQMCLLHVLPELSEGDDKVWGVWSGAFIGIVERPFFALAVGFNLGGCVVGMFAWCALRNVSLWQSVAASPARRFAALLLAFSSMFAALIGGLMLRAA